VEGACTLRQPRLLSVLGQDLFDLFPKELRPTNRAAIIGGVGGVSSLHADAYNWTGHHVYL
jgi:hypothetical protein